MLSLRSRFVISSLGKRFSTVNRVRLGVLSGAAGWMIAANHSYAYCAADDSSASLAPAAGGENPVSSSNNSSGSADPFDPIKAMVSRYYEYAVNQLGISGCVGVCCGVAFKRVGRGIALAIGMTFTGLQALSYLGYVKIDYNKVAKDANKVLDVNGDGKFDSRDIEHLVTNGKSMLSSQLPSVGGFCSGFVIGLYFG